jgi:hypothetical protein
MLPLARRLFLASLLALYGFVTLGGPALHALPGCGHAGALQTNDQDAGNRAQPGPPSLAGDDCPICHFHAQGQFLFARDRDFCTDVVRIRPADEPRLIAPTPHVRVSIPRAPPLV